LKIKRTKNAADRQSPKGLAGSKDDSHETHAVVEWSGRARLIASLLISLHLLAVFAEPLRFFSRSPENFAAADTAFLRRTLGPYVDAMYLSHGYFFFAPNPGPAHLIECQVTPNNELANGSGSEVDKSKWKIYPDRKDQWPRLLYHRHFMLSEFYNTLFAPTDLENVAESDQRIVQRITDQWREDRRIYESLQDCLKQNLLSKYPEHSVVLKRIQHELPNPRTIFVDRWKLTDPRLYNELLEGPVKELVNEQIPEQMKSETSVPASLDTPGDAKEIIEQIAPQIAEQIAEQIIPQKQINDDAKMLDENNKQIQRPRIAPSEPVPSKPVPSETRGAR